MRNNADKNIFKKYDSRFAGTIGTVIFHALLLIFLLYFGIKAYLPQEEEGLTVNYGTDDFGSGLFEPAPQSAIEEYLVDEPVPPVAVPPAPAKPVSGNEDIQTQDIEESLKIQEREKQRQAEEQKRLEAERKAAEEKERLRQAELKRQQENAQREKAMAAGRNAFAAGGKGDAGSTAQSQGISAFGGNQGKPEGVANSNNYSGGSTGSGHSYGLNGRSIVGKLPEPAYNKNVEGVIVVSIEVDGKGNVISAKAGAAGTTIGDATMRRNAEQAALKAKFNGIDEDMIQSGTITYRYKLN